MATALSTPITFGRRLHRAAVAELTVTASCHRAGAQIARHAHEVANLYVTLAGGFSETVERAQMTGAPGTMIVKPGGARHSNRYGLEDVVGVVIEAPDSAQDRLGLRTLFGDRRQL